MTTLFNSIFTHHSQTFMLTRRSFYWLVKKDPNVNSNSLSGQEYSAMISKMLSSGDFIYLREPVGRKAGVLKVVNPDIVQTLYRLHGKEWFDMQEQKVCDYYDNKTDLEKPKTSFKDNFNKFKEDTKDEW